MAKRNTIKKSEPNIISQVQKKTHKLNIKPIGEQEMEVIKYDDPDIVIQMEKEWPEMTDEFKRIMFTQYELFCKKQSNYGPDNIAAGTSLSTDEDIKLSLTGLFFRINDKVQRIKNLIVLGKKDNVGEVVDDTFQDLSIYGIIAQIVKNDKWGK